MCRCRWPCVRKLIPAALCTNDKYVHGCQVMMYVFLSFDVISSFSFQFFCAKYAHHVSLALRTKTDMSSLAHEHQITYMDVR